MVKRFTVEEANQLLPFLRAELEQLRSIQTTFNRKYQTLNQLNPSQVSEDGVFTLESELEFLQMEASLHIGNIRKSGAELKDIVTGLIDFPSIRDGEEILLCWKTDEPEVIHYHSREDGFMGRKPLY